jgi:D-glycero-D-manno-heptose 1,7-bisphosphate phosphatase
VKLAERFIEPTFLLMYSDNYWPMRMDRVWPRFEAAGEPAMITVYSNRDGYTANSVRVDDDGYVAVYDRSKQSPGLQGVEISYAIMKREVLELLSGENELFEVAVYPKLAEQRKLLAHVTHHRYYSIGSYQRLPLTEEFFKRIPTVFIDRDGVLNRKPPRAEYVRTWADFEWLPGAKDALRRLHEVGFRVIVLSNQAGIGRGEMTEEDLAQIHERMLAETLESGGRIDAIYHCPHGWEDGCECRKPKPGMLFQAQREHHLDLTRTTFIGDDERDAEAADAAGAPSLLLREGDSLVRAVDEVIRRERNLPDSPLAAASGVATVPSGSRLPEGVV